MSYPPLGNPAGGSWNGDIVFPLFGFPVRIRPVFWLVTLLMGAGGRGGPTALFAWIVVAAFSVLVHELGHAFAARGRSAVVLGIELNAMGGATHWRGLRPLAGWERVMISVAGPGAGFLLAFLAYRLQPEGPLPPLLAMALWNLIVINIVWGIFNLVPLVPLDGGRALEAALVSWSPQRGAFWTAAIGAVVGTALSVAALWFGQYFAAILVGLLTWQQWMVLKAHRDAGRHTRRYLP